MSATNQTATIELSQYVSTDKPTYLTDYNGDMLKIDNAIAADRDSISTAQSTANTAEHKADTNKTNIDALNVQLNGDPEDPSDIGIAGDLNAVEGTVNTVTSLIGNGSPTTSDQTIIGAINGLEGIVAPREDGESLALSYTAGEQFARGASLYKALVSLTAGTAFESLVLNTDYELSSSLVEQIANAGHSQLPSGYYYKKVGESYGKNGDGTSTTIQFMRTLASDFLTDVVSQLEVNEKLEIIDLSLDRTVLPTERRFFTRNSGSVNGYFGGPDVQPNNTRVECPSILFASGQANEYKIVRIDTNGASVVSKESSIVTTGSRFSLRYNVIAPF